MFTRKPMQTDSQVRPSTVPPVRSQLSETLTERIDNTTVNVATLPGEGLVVIGKGTRVFGQISDCRKLDVFGVVEADVIAEMIVVHEGGGLKGHVQTDKADIHGVVEGSLQVYEHLEIHRTADINGDVTYGSLSVAAGAKLIGSVQTHADYRAAATEPHTSSNLVPVEGAPNGAANGNGKVVQAPSRPIMRH